MDNGVSSQTSAKILAAIENGALSKEETERRINALIEEELTREDAPADMELVGACEYLLLSTKSEETKSLISAVVNDGRAFERRKKLIRRIHRKAISRQIIRISYVSAALILCVFCLDMIRLQWLRGTSTDDQQQYVVSGNEIDPQVIGHVDAEQESRNFSLSTDNLQEALDALDFSPAIPMPDGFTPQTYNVLKTRHNTTFSIQYIDRNDDQLLTYQAIFYDDIAEQKISFEQNKEGKAELLGDQTVYVMQNFERTSCMWSDGPILYKLTCKDPNFDWQSILVNMKGDPNK